MTGRATWPAHLRDDAPSQQCGRCGRYTWSPSEFGTECRMTQPDGFPCGGRFEPREDGRVLHLYAARVGTPIPSDALTPLPEAYDWVGVGKVRLTEMEPAWTGDVFSRAVVGDPQMIIAWDVYRGGWQDASATHALPLHTIIGHAITDDGWVVRMIAHRTGRTEHETRGDRHTTTIDLHRDQRTGGVVTWYYRKTRPAPGETWRGRNHGGLVKVLAVDDSHVTVLMVSAGNPWWTDKVGTTQRFVLTVWDDYLEYAPEWNDPR